MGGELTEAPKIYGRLWKQAVALFKSGGPRIDPFLRKKADDTRRGLTLVARPDAGVRKEVGKFLREAAVICPGQYFYKPAELHVTVLAVIPGTESWRARIGRLPACLAVLDQVLKNRRAFTVEFCGVTASPEAVMIQGFPVDDSLNRLRDELRNALRKHDLDEILDGRYRIATAHLTAMRFSNSRANWKQFLHFLQTHRETDFGETRFSSLQLIWGDWYASGDVVRLLRKFPLRD
jgi:2'-5' RNA ligase